MRFLHTMLRVRDLDAALDFFVRKLGLRELRRRDHAQGRFTLVFLGTGDERDAAEIELTHNWDQSEPYATGRFFGHLAFEVDDIHATCARLRDAGVTDKVINYMIDTPGSVGANTAAPSTVVVQQAPPPPPVETLVVAPGPGYVWIGGEWIWAGGWVWRAGYWGLPPRGYSVWVGGRAWHDGQHWHAERGHWR